MFSMRVRVYIYLVSCAIPSTTVGFYHVLELFVILPCCKRYLALYDLRTL